MSDHEKSPPEDSSAEAFDLAQLRELIEMMEQHGVTEVNLRHGRQQWRVRRGPGEMAMPAAFAQPVGYAPPTATAAPPPPAAASESEPAGAAANAGLEEIKSPAVGTFYSTPSPDDPPFVKVGSKVSPETTVCLIEAMKVFNQIPAECSGVIEKILVKDGDAIDFGQPLFLIRPG